MDVRVERQLIVYDFDWSMADQDTDRWIFEVLAPELRRKMKNLKDEIQWTDLVAQTLRDAHNKGITKEQIEGALKIMPFHPAMVRAVQSLKAKANPHTTFLCLSNANSVFISTILKVRLVSYVQPCHPPVPVHHYSPVSERMCPYRTLFCLMPPQGPEKS
ncbi:hypothetical protein EUX98_g3339 [Antrodiella citrinella]|uniref:Uncharacterized protein n=1 Tax=Antrodiella citrinella TaxID=2447956 RepID=A0A4S4MWT6_9APHY|nr:hypothetical protein EUX98_g3339 [Antrodiella citrinella]